MTKTRALLPLAVLALPDLCFAQTLSAWVGLFNIIIGIVLVAALLFMAAA